MSALPDKTRPFSTTLPTAIFQYNSNLTLPNGLPQVVWNQFVFFAPHQPSNCFWSHVFVMCSVEFLVGGEHPVMVVVG